MKELIERLERATGPDREIDLDIWKALHPDREVSGVWSSGGCRFVANHDEYSKARYETVLRNASWRDRPNEADYRHHDELKDYTASLDAALTLVPEGWTRFVDATAPECRIDVDLFAPGPHGTRVRGVHDSEPIATVIAAIRAREQVK